MSTKKSARTADTVTDGEKKLLSNVIIALWKGFVKIELR